MCEIIEPLPSSEALCGTVSTDSVVLLPGEEVSKVLIQELCDCRVTDQLVRQLHDAMALGTFDVVFCRNVLIYFDIPTKAKVLAAVHRQMPADGYLVLGAAETVLGVTEMFNQSPGLPGIYVP